MGWREEVLLDQQFFGPPTGQSEVQRKIVGYIAGAVGGIMTTLNCIHYLKRELEQHAPDAAVKLGLSQATDQGAKDVGPEAGRISGNDSGGHPF